MHLHKNLKWNHNRHEYIILMLFQFVFERIRISGLQYDYQYARILFLYCALYGLSRK